MMGSLNWYPSQVPEWLGISDDEAPLMGLLVFVSEGKTVSQ